jgi:hypothetical protein
MGAIEVLYARANIERLPIDKAYASCSSIIRMRLPDLPAIAQSYRSDNNSTLDPFGSLV